MREWLSWWSTTLPRWGSRVRVPSRALLMEKMRSSIWMASFFALKSTSIETGRPILISRACEMKSRCFLIPVSRGLQQGVQLGYIRCFRAYHQYTLSFRTWFYSSQILIFIICYLHKILLNIQN